MSLINDALKRAGQAQKREPRAERAPASSGPAMQPVDTSPAKAFPWWIVGVLAVAALAVVFFLFEKRRGETKPDPAPAPAVVVSRPAAPAATVAPAPKPVALVKAPEVKAPEARPPTAAVVVSKPPVAPAAIPEKVVAPAPAPVAATFPTLKLQGIFFRLRNPSVVINGKTVFVGEEVEGAKVTQIDRYSASLQFHGEKHVLKME